MKLLHEQHVVAHQQIANKNAKYLTNMIRQNLKRCALIMKYINGGLKLIRIWQCESAYFQP